MIPAACAFASASAIWMAYFRTSFNFSPRRGISWPSVLPWTYSMTMKSVPLSLAMSWMVMMLG